MVAQSAASRSCYTDPMTKRPKAKGKRQKALTIVVSLVFLLFYFILRPSAFVPRPSYAISAQLDDLQKQIDDLSRLRQLSEAATTPLEAQLKDLDSRTAFAQKGIYAAAAQKDKQIIAGIELESTEIENTQNSLKSRKVQLETLQAKLDKEAEFFRGE